MGARATSALAIAVVPHGLEAKVEATLHQLLAGALPVLRAAGCVLVGGHTCEGADLSLGKPLPTMQRAVASLWQSEEVLWSQVQSHIDADLNQIPLNLQFGGSLMQCLDRSDILAKVLTGRVTAA